MANIKQVNVIERIQQLYRQGASQRRIARELGVSRNTVARYAGKTPGAPVGGGSVSDHATHGVPAGPDGQNEPQATHGVAQFDKKQRYVERRLETEPNTDMQLFYRR